MLFGKKKHRRDGVMDDAAIIAAITTLATNDGVTVERIDWDGSRSTVSGRVSFWSNGVWRFPRRHRRHTTPRQTSFSSATPWRTLC